MRKFAPHLFLVPVRCRMCSCERSARKVWRGAWPAPHYGVIKLMKQHPNPQYTQPSFFGGYIVLPSPASYSSPLLSLLPPCTPSSPSPTPPLTLYVPFLLFLPSPPPLKSLINTDESHIHGGSYASSPSYTVYSTYEEVLTPADTFIIQTFTSTEVPTYYFLFR